jgi:hypothetical protein
MINNAEQCAGIIVAEGLIVRSSRRMRRDYDGVHMVEHQ